MRHYNVPKLSYNLLRVSKATKSGKSCVFTNSGCQNIDDKRIVATGTKAGNIHHLNCIENQKAAHTATSRSTSNTREKVWHFCHLRAKDLMKLLLISKIRWKKSLNYWKLYTVMFVAR